MQVSWLYLETFTAFVKYRQNATNSVSNWSLFLLENDSKWQQNQKLTCNRDQDGAQKVHIISWFISYVQT